MYSHGRNKMMGKKWIDTSYTLQLSFAISAFPWKESFLYFHFFYLNNQSSQAYPMLEKSFQRDQKCYWVLQMEQLGALRKPAAQSILA